MADIAETVVTNTKTINTETVIKEWQVAMELLQRIIWAMVMEAAMGSLVDLRAWTITACNKEDSAIRATITLKESPQMAISSSNNNPNFTNNLLDCRAPQMTPTWEVLDGHLEEDKIGEEAGSETIREGGYQYHMLRDMQVFS